jgi:hypothetical protein
MGGSTLQKHEYFSNDQRQFTPFSTPPERHALSFAALICLP